MTMTYLQQTLSAIVAADGTATIQLRPAVGQFWAPSVVRVASRVTPQNTQNANASYCAIFHGSVPAIDPTSFLDDTYLGSGDSSSVIAGTIVSYGEAITAQWMNGLPGDTVILSLYGRSSNDLVELQDRISPIPGAKFSGNTGSAMLWSYNDFTIAGPSNVPWSWTTPFNLLCELVAINFRVVTSAAAGNRAYGVQATVFDGVTTVPLMTVYPNGVVQPASSTFNYSYSQGINNFVSNTQVGTALPSKIILPPGALVSLVNSGFVSALDTFSGLAITFRQYKSLAEVGYT